jgi:hypothetical protein
MAEVRRVENRPDRVARPSWKGKRRVSRVGGDSFVLSLTTGTAGSRVSRVERPRGVTGTRASALHWAIGVEVDGYPAQPVMEPGGSQLSGRLPLTVLLLSGTVPEKSKTPPP